VILALLLFAGALAPALEKQILDAFAPGDAPRSLSPLLEVEDGAARLLVLCGESRAPRPLLARIVNGALAGDPVEIASGLAGRANCGEAKASAPFTVRRKGASATRAVVLSFSDGGAPFLAAAVSLSPEVLTWTDAKGREGEPLLSLRKGRGDTTFCVLQRDRTWSLVTYSAQAGGYSPSKPCAPEGAAKGK
jgi:hypothetical protein